MKKELLIFVGLFIFLALGMHKDQWLDHPVEHIMNLPTSGAFFLGPEHPFVFTLIAYLLVGLVRLVIRSFSTKKED